MALTFRSVKGSALTHNELDANFSTLNQERSASEFNASGRTVKFGTGKDLHLPSATGYINHAGSTTYITLYGCFFWSLQIYINPQYNVNVSISLNTGEYGVLLIYPGPNGNNLTFPSNLRWVNNSTGINSSGQTSSIGWSAPNGSGTAFDYAGKLFSFWRDSSGEYYGRFHGKYEDGYISTANEYHQIPKL